MNKFISLLAILIISITGVVSHADSTTYFSDGGSAQTFSYGGGDSTTYYSDGTSAQTFSYGGGDSITYYSDGSSSQTFGY